MSEPPTQEQIAAGRLKYTGYEQHYANFAARWNKGLQDGKTQAYHPNSYTLDEAYHLLNESDFVHTKGMAVESRFFGWGDYNPSTNTVEHHYNKTEALQRVIGIQSQLQFLIHAKTHGQPVIVQQGAIIDIV